MNIAAIDLSLSSPGIAVAVKNNDLLKKPILYHNSMQTKKLNGPERWHCILKFIMSILEEYNVREVYIEGYAYGLHSASSQVLAEMNGILRWELFKKSIHWCLVAPMIIKKHISGKGNADKEHVLECVKRLGYKPSNHDEADAIALALYALENDLNKEKIYWNGLQKPKLKKPKKIKKPACEVIA